MIKLKIPVADLLAIRDPRDVPAYSIPVAARYLRIPVATVRSWVLGRKYPRRDGGGFFKPIIKIPNPRAPILSFYNLAEAHVLGAFRREHAIPMQDIRNALNYVSKRFGWTRPLVQQEFQTDGIGLLIERLGALIDAGRGGQKVIRQCVEERLARLEWEDSLVTRLYPFTRLQTTQAPRLVMIDPQYSFGQPVLVNSRVATAVVAERYKAGDSVTHLARDYACQTEEIEEAIRCELEVSVAA